MDFNDRHKWIKYKDQDFLYVDYTNIDENELSDFLSYIGSYIYSLNLKTIKQIGNLINIDHFSIKEINSALNKNIFLNLYTYRKTAVLTTSDYLIDLIDFWNSEYKENLKIMHFDNIEDAKEWLIQD